MFFDFPVQIIPDEDYRIDPPLKTIKGIAYNQNYICIYGKKENIKGNIKLCKLPYILFRGKQTFSPIGDIKKCTERITCASVSNVLYKLVAGHRSGNISIFDVYQKSLSMKINRNNEERKGIKYVTYVEDDLSILAVDYGNKIYHFTEIDHTISTKEKCLYKSPLKIKKVFMHDTNSTFFIFSTKDSLNVYYLNEINDNVVDIIPKQNEKLDFIAKSKRDCDYLIVVAWYSNCMQIFCINHSFGYITPLLTKHFSVKIKNVAIKCNYSINVLLVDGTLTDISNYENDEVTEDYYDSNEIKEKLKKITRITVFGDTTYLFNLSKLYRMQYIPWNLRLNALSRKGEFMTCFRLANEIYSDTAVNLYGINKDPSIRCTELQKIMSDILYNSLCSLDDSKQIACAFMTAIRINMTNFVINTAYNFYKDDGNLEFYYEAIFNCTEINISQYLPFEIYSTLIEKAKESNKLKQAESAIIETGIPFQYAEMLLDLALKNDMKKLLIKLWTDVFHDYISPCTYFYKTELYIKYINSIFLTDNLNNDKSQKQIVLLWLCTQIGGTYPRLFVLMSKKPQKAPVLISKFIELVPIILNDGTCFSIEAFCNIILQSILSFDKEIQNSCIDIISKIMVLNKIHVSLLCLKMLIRWIFKTTTTSINIRERMILMLCDQYPDILKIEDIIDYCEAAGFSTILNSICIQSKDYSRVFHCMFLSEERSKFIFDYIENPNLDPLYFLQIDENIVKEELKENKNVNFFINDEMNLSIFQNAFEKSIYYINQFIEQLIIKYKENIYPLIVNDNSDSDFYSDSSDEYTEYESSSSEENDEESEENIKGIEEEVEEIPQIKEEEENNEFQQEIPKLCDQEMENSVRENYTLLLLIDADKTVKLFLKYFPSFHDAFLGSDESLFYKFLYLQALHNSDFYDFMNSENDFELLILTCKFAPSNVIPLIKRNQTINMEDILRVCKQYRVIDACMYIHTLRGDFQSAVNLVAEEVEAVIVDVIQTGDEIYAESVDLIKEVPQLKKAYETLNISFNLFSKAPKIQQMLDKMWKNLFLAFQLPLYLACNCGIPETTNAISLFFAYFVVEALQRTSPENVFEILKSEFCLIDQLQYRNILSAVFKYLDYNQMISSTVSELLLNDCIRLYGTSFEVKTKAAFAMNPNCAMCNTPITGVGGIGGLIYECGHVYHNDAKCGQFQKKCVICKNDVISNTQHENIYQVKENSHLQLRKLRKLKRVDFGLKNHFEKKQYYNESGTSIFFLNEIPVKHQQPIKLSMGKIPDERFLFLEL